MSILPCPPVLPWHTETPESVHAVELVVILALDVRGLGMINQMWEVKAVVTLPFLIHATLAPVQIHIEIDTPQVSILPRDIIFGTGSDFFDQDWIHDLVREQIQAQLLSRIQEQLKDPNPRIIDIQKIVDRMPQPKLDAPDPKASAPISTGCRWIKPPPNTSP